MALAPLRGSGAHEVWSSDGQHLASSVPAVGISIARADGASPPQPLVRERTLLPSSFSPDGRRLAYSQGGQLWTVSLERQGDLWKAGTPERFMENTFRETSAAFSPDGRWLAYQSNESGKDEVYVRPSSHSPSRRGGKWQISNSGGTAPRWSRTGDIVYQSGDQILAARYKADGDAFVADKPRVWIANFSGTRREGERGWHRRRGTSRPTARASSA